jgi:cytochrome c oxidase subunit IV
MITLKTYFTVFTVLLILTVVTTAVAFVNLGPWNIAVALAIAFAKATLVGLYFMHLRHSSRLTLVFVAASFLWLSHMIVSSLSDYITRAW